MRAVTWPNYARTAEAPQSAVSATAATAWPEARGRPPLELVPVETTDIGEPVVIVALTADTDIDLERARTALETGTAWTSIPTTRAETNLLGVNRILKELAVVAYTGAFITSGSRC
ncbi:hypothetical protein [Devosia sp. Root413D1]|uniref:hypothetical protein n=1 Tax=Devosia sp. Root413D1 TaxID=1736531 RepID=UPI000A7F4372|nr:hypothetical protein [Devosia sp. Root413D1]